MDGVGALVGGTTHTGNELRGRALQVEGDTVRIRLVADDTQAGVYGYGVVSIVDQTGRPAPADLVLPASEHPHVTPIDEERIFVMPDSLGTQGCAARTRGRASSVGCAASVTAWSASAAQCDPP